MNYPRVIRMTSKPAIAYFISPHGFGHASRAAAIMAALADLSPEIRFELFTTSPRWIFQDAAPNRFGYHDLQTDIGLVQTSPLYEDLGATVLQLDRMLPFDPDLVRRLADEVTGLGCRLVVCDIAPLGIAVARLAGLDSVLVENFTWDWIYRGYLHDEPRLQSHMEYLGAVFRKADHHIQTSPLCNPLNGTVNIAPISRRPHSTRERVRTRLGLSATDRMVLVSMGGVPDRFDFLAHLPAGLNTFLVIPGADGRTIAHPKIILLPTHSEFYHPDLMAAADALVAKAGYSTVAEAYQAGLPFGYVRRPQSPESLVLEEFIIKHLPAESISARSYGDGSWIKALPRLLALPRTFQARPNGAGQAARHLLGML
jgi:hypothetical protein